MEDIKDPSGTLRDKKNALFNHRKNTKNTLDMQKKSSMNMETEQ